MRMINSHGWVRNKTHENRQQTTEMKSIEGEIVFFGSFIPTTTANILNFT